MPRYRPYKCPECGEFVVLGLGVGEIKCKNCGHYFSGGKGYIELPGGYTLKGTRWPE